MKKNEHNLTYNTRCPKCGISGCYFDGQITYYYRGVILDGEINWSLTSHKQDYHISQIICDCGYRSSIYSQNIEHVKDVCYIHKTKMIGAKVNQIQGQIIKGIPILKKEDQGIIFCHKVIS